MLILAACLPLFLRLAAHIHLWYVHFTKKQNTSNLIRVFFPLSYRIRVPLKHLGFIYLITHATFGSALLLEMSIVSRSF